MLKRLFLGLFASISVIVLFSLLVSCGSGSGDGSVEAENPAKPTYTSLSSNVFTNEPYDVTELSVDPSTGQTIVRTRLTILFRPTATAQQVNELFARINAIVTASIAGARSAGIRIPDPGSVDALNTIIADIEGEAFVEAVMKSVQLQPSALPDNVDEDNDNDLKIIDNQLAVGGPAAWNAKEAIGAAPNVIIMDWFGDGSAQLNNFLDLASLSGFWFENGTDMDEHGYHVAGIVNGSFGGGNSAAGLVTGMMPGPINLNLIDLSTPIPGFDAYVRALLSAQAMGGTVIMNTSLGYDCDDSTNDGSCNDTVRIMIEAITWANLVRAAGMESHLFHATAAGNRAGPRYDARDTETQHPFSAAATMTSMSTVDGDHVPPLTNTVAVENLSGTDHPRRVECLDENSFVGGTISGIGTDVTSLGFTSTKVFSGTSMATPQVAGLAAYMASLDPTLSPQEIKRIMLDTAQDVPTIGGANCSDWGAPAPAIDAYAAVLALDKSTALDGTRSHAPVRNAILDIVDQNPAEQGSNGQFDENDLMYFIEQIEKGSDEIRQNMPKVKYSRADLNGDAYDGGGTGSDADNYREKFNLDIDYPPTYTTVKQMIEGEEVEFDENALTDNDILCYYAYSSLYTGDTSERKDLMEGRCQPGIMAVYYWHQNDIKLFGDSCEDVPVPDDVQETRESFTTLDDFALFINRPESHYWHPGDLDIEQEMFSISGISGFLNSDSICVNQAFSGRTILDTMLEHSATGRKLEIDISATAESECHDVTDNLEWECSKAAAFTKWEAHFDYEIEAATTLKVILDLQCTGPNMSSPGYPDPNIPALLPPTDVYVHVTRFNANGEGVIQYRDDLSKLFVPLNLYCNDMNPVVQVEQLIEFDAPEKNGETDTAVVIVSGAGGAFGNLGNLDDLPGLPVQLPPPPQDGEIGIQTNRTTMTGTISVVPAN